jgi:methylenetetrahydrofolate dehydrogenase (NADP+) / methenyltetrahydrofolate cyclohydrolase
MSEERGRILDGKEIAAAVRQDVKKEVDAWTAEGNPVPVLRVVLVGDDPASASYVRGKTAAASEAGIDGKTLTYGSDITEENLLSLIAELNADPGVDGILVQLPLPKHINEEKIINAIDPDKDVDGFHPENAGRLVIGQPGFVSATPAGIMEMMKRAGISPRGAHAVIIGRSNIVGKPVANLLIQKGTDATVTVCHSRTRDLPAITRQADILIAAIGQPEFVKADMVREGAVVIDVGINRVEDADHPRGYRLVGDVAYDEVKPRASWITPVPGGVGPMTIAMLLQNTFLAARRRAAARA